MLLAHTQCSDPKDKLHYRENVIFNEIKTVSISRSQWLFSFIIDLNPFQTVIDRSHKNIKKVRNVIYKVLQNYDSYKANTNKEIHVKYIDLFQRQTAEIIHIERTLNTITELYNDLQSFQSNNKDDTNTRRKRSVLPFMGNVLHFLFGVSTDSSLAKVKSAFKKLAKEQNTIKHVIKENLSIINISRTEIQENRHTINGLIYSMEEASIRFQNITNSLRRKIFDLNYFINIFLQADILIQEMRETNAQALSYINNINQQLNAFGTGHITQSIIPPKQLKQILSNIAHQLPETLSLPADIDENLWFYYRFLRCTLITKDNKFLIISSIHINDVSAKYSIFQIINVPVGYTNTTAVAFYKIDHSYLAISLDNTKYMFLSPSQALLCTHSLSNLCAPSTPIYPVITSKSCAISLFMHKSVNQNCKKMISSDTTLPSAIYITDGLWVITLIESITMTMVCDLNHKSRYIIKPFFQIIKLKHNCHAFSDVITLPAYFQGHSQAHIANTHESLVSVFNQSMILPIWKNIKEEKDFHIKLPPHLDKIQNINVKKLIDTLQDTNKDMPQNFNNWQTYTLITIASSVSIIIIYSILKRIPFFQNLFNKIKVCVPSGKNLGRQVPEPSHKDGVTQVRPDRHEAIYPTLPIHTINEVSVRQDVPGLSPNDIDSDCQRCGPPSIHQVLRQ